MSIKLKMYKCFVLKNPIAFSTGVFFTFDNVDKVNQFYKDNFRHDHYAVSAVMGMAMTG